MGHAVVRITAGWRIPAFWSQCCHDFGQVPGFLWATFSALVKWKGQIKSSLRTHCYTKFCNLLYHCHLNFPPSSLWESMLLTSWERCENISLEPNTIQQHVRSPKSSEWWGGSIFITRSYCTLASGSFLCTGPVANLKYSWLSSLDLLTYNRKDRDVGRTGDVERIVWA